MDRTTVEEIALRLDREAEHQREAAGRMADPGRHRISLDPSVGEFDPTTVRSTRLILADFARNLARDLRASC